MEGLEEQYQGSSRSTRARWMARNSSNERMDTSEGSNRTRWVSREANSDIMDGSDGSHRDRWSQRHVAASGDVLNYRMDDIEEHEDASEAHSDHDN